jgi:hypothetical protein
VKPEERREISHNASEGVEPRNSNYCRWAKGFDYWKPAASYAKRRVYDAGPGSKSMAGLSTVEHGTWESHAAPLASG